jgi:hypothetical protein
VRRLAVLAAVSAVLSTLVLLAGPAAPANACSQVFTDPFATADFVVEGTVTDVQPLAGSADRDRVTVAVDDTLKGAPRQSTTVGAPRATAPASCAYAFDLGARYRVFGHVDARRGDIDGWADGRWRILAARTQAQTTARTGDPHPTGPVLAILAIAGLTATVVIRRVRRRRAQ